MFGEPLDIQSHTQFTHANRLEIVDLGVDAVLRQPLEVFAVDMVVHGDAPEKGR